MKDYVNLESEIIRIMQRNYANGEIITEDNLEYLISLGLDINMVFSFGTLLHLAVIYNSMILAKLLVKKNIDVNLSIHLETFGKLDLSDNIEISLEPLMNATRQTDQIQPRFLTALYLAYVQNHFELFEFLLESGADPNKHSLTAGNLFHIMGMAICDNNIPAIKSLLKTGLNLDNIFGPYSAKSTIEYIYACDNIEVFKIFVDAGVNLNVKNFGGTSFLEKLCLRGEVELAEIVFNRLKSQSQNDLKMPQIKNYERAKFFNSLKLPPQNLSQMDDQIAEFHVAVYNSDLEKVRNLINSGIDGKKLAKFDRKILHLACIKGDKEIVKLLLDCGVDVGITEAGNTTALDACLMVKGQWSVSIAKIILEHIIERSIPYTDFSTFSYLPLHCLSLFDDPKLTAAFLEREINIDLLDEDGKTPLQEAALLGNQNLFFALLKKGANPNVETPYSPILVDACLGGNLNIINKLLKFNMNMKAKNQIGRGALHAAAFKGDSEIVQLLTFLGINIDLQDHFGLTPLHLAIEKYKIQAIEALLQVGADLEIKDNSGRNALEIAKITQNKEAEDLISKTITKRKEENKVKFHGVYDNIFKGFLSSETRNQQSSSETSETSIAPDKINIAFPISPSARSSHSR